MSVIITNTSVLQSLADILNGGYLRKLNVTTIKGKTSCSLKKKLLNYMILDVLADEQIGITEDECDCLKDEFNFTQSCSDAE